MAYNIGEFAKLCGVTNATLRYWEKEGLIEAGYINEANGYRQYTAAQLDRVYTIKALKDMGYAIYDIKKLMVEGISVPQLIQKRDKFEADIVKARDRISNLNYMINDFQRKVVIKKEIPEESFLCGIYTVTSYEDIMRALHEMLNEVKIKGIDFDRDYGFRVLTDTRFFSNKKFEITIMLKVPKIKGMRAGYMTVPPRTVIASLSMHDQEFLFNTYNNMIIWSTMNDIILQNREMELYFFAVDFDSIAIDPKVRFPMELSFDLDCRDDGMDLFF